MTKKIIAIWAEDENHLIGKDDRLPWFLPKELQHFKKTTMGHALLMGRVTFDGMKRRILPGRTTLILSRTAVFEEEVVGVNSVEAVLEWFNNQENHLFIVGGSSVYKLFEPYYDMIIQTKVHASFEGDTYLPELDFSSFECVEQVFYKKDEKNQYDFTINTLKKCH